jgi:hypothetical protein
MSQNRDSKDNITLGSSKIKVLEDNRYIIFIQILGWGLLCFCIYLWIYNFLIIEVYKRTTHTTYITLILISFTCINKLESALFNSLSLVTFFLFIIMTIIFIPLATDFNSLMAGVILHGFIAGFQAYLFFNNKISISKKYLLWGFLFYVIFINLYDSYARIHAAIEMDNQLTIIMTQIIIFYTLALSIIGIYLYKKRFGIILF